jgi:hypothetical protein
VWFPLIMAAEFEKAIECEYTEVAS